MKNYRCYRRSCRYSFVLFCNLIDTCGLNAYVIFCANNPEWNAKKSDRRRRFLLELGKQLVLPAVQRRNITHLAIPLKASIQTFLEKNSLSTSDRRNNQFEIDFTAYCTEEPVAAKGTIKPSGRCEPCGRQKDRKSSIKCSLCRNFVCPEHRRTITSSICNHCAGVDEK